MCLDLRNLPEYQRNGVAIGDVGRVTPDGIFDFFFNIYLPPGHPINANIPEAFSPMVPFAPIDLVHLDFSPGSYISTSTVQKLDLDPPLDEFPEGEFVFSCTSPEGAVLALPHGSHLQRLENLENLRAYAAQHAESWYKYINGARGRGLANGSLYLVTGWEKAQSWGMASFHNTDDEFQLIFKPNPDSNRLQYRWGGAHARRNPARKKYFCPMNSISNQTTFIHGLSISLGRGNWGRLFGDVEIRPIVDSQFGSAKGDATTHSQGSSFLSWSFSLLTGGGTTTGKHHAGGNDATAVSEFAPIPPLFHPAALINDYILQMTPQARVVLSHTDDWSEILGHVRFLCPKSSRIFTTNK
ncbi:hypothetical protein C8R43DRAFT_72172 [Mycena crocata]|nr:hypothetical protein C8R43DRAFT_72172 [Mycena crocata]